METSVNESIDQDAWMDEGRVVRVTRQNSKAGRTLFGEARKIRGGSTIKVFSWLETKAHGRTSYGMYFQVNEVATEKVDGEVITVGYQTVPSQRPFRMKGDIQAVMTKLAQNLASFE